MEKALNYREIRPNLHEYLQEVAENRHPIALILDGVNNKRNLASIFRLADAARVAEVILHNCYLPEGDYKIRRVARSAQEFVPIREINDLLDIAELKNTYRLVALEITNNSIPYYQYQDQQPVGLVVGNEQKGVSQNLLSLCAASVHVPMMGRNSSMNVAMATGIATYGLLQQMGRLT